MVTLKDVAEEAGVSVQLVSVVVNGKADRYRISQSTRERVEETVKTLGYDPVNSRGARQMAARKHGIRIPNNVIAVCSISDVIPMGPIQQVTSFRMSPYDNEILAGIDAAAYEYGLDILSCRHYGNKLPRLIENGEVDGVILMGSSLSVMQQIANLKIPAVKLIGKYKRCHNVVIDNYQGMYDTVKYLVDLGHQAIAYIGQLVDGEMENPPAFVPSRERFAGFEQAMQDCGLTPEYVDVSLDEQNLEVAAAAMEKLWKKSRGKITAVVCYNDILAMGAIRYLESLGLTIPKDVSVTGFDDISQQFAFEPSISSVYYDRIKLGYRAVEVLRQSRDSWLAGEKIKWVHEVLPVEFVARQSTAPPCTQKEKM